MDHNYYDDQFVSEQQQSSNNRATIAESSSSLIGIFSRLMSDCFDDELVALNQDFKDDVIISGIKNLLSDEYVEFREDNNMCRQEEGEGNEEGQHDLNDIAMLQSMLIDQNNNNGDGGYSSVDDTTRTASTKNNDDDERSDFLVRRKSGVIFNNSTTTASEMTIIPSSIQFKPNKNRNRNTSRLYQTPLSSSQKEGKPSNNNYSNINSNYSNRNTNTNDQKSSVQVSRWRNKKGLHLLSFRKKN